MGERARKTALVVGLGISLAAVLPAAKAGMGPLRALPQGWSATPANGYGSLTDISGNEGSAMCVECHKAAPRNTNTGPFPFGESRSDYYGSHFVRNRSFDGSENDYTTPTTPVDKTAIEKVDAWASGAISRYGAPDFTYQASATRGEVICESCHNMLDNMGDSLTLDVWDEATGDSALCTGCHTVQAAGPPDHHPMTDHIVGPDAENGAAHPLDITHTSHVLNPVVDPDTTGGINYFSNGVTCMSCHKPHDGMTATGARVLRRGRSASTGVAADLSVNVTYYNDIPDDFVTAGTVIMRLPAAATLVTGIHRQDDMVATKRLVVNQDPLCDSCH